MLEEDKAYDFQNGYRLEKMAGKDNTYLLRNEDGLIVAFIEQYNNIITSFREYQDRRLPNSVVNKIIEFISRSSFHLSKEAAKYLGVSIIKIAEDNELYLKSTELNSKALKPYLMNSEQVILIVNNIKKINLKIPAFSHNCMLDLQNANIGTLTISHNVIADLDLRNNRNIKELIVEYNYQGKLFLSRSNIKKLTVADNCTAEINYLSGNGVLDINIGNKFNGIINIKDSYLKNLKTGSFCHAHININTCIFYYYINIGSHSSSSINISSVFARYLKLGDFYSGKLSGSSVSSKQGVRTFYIGDDFSGDLDLSMGRTIQRIEVGSRASGYIGLIACPSIKLLTIDSEFSGIINLSESGIVYLRANAPCQGRFELNGCNHLTLLQVPQDLGYKVLGAPKPLKIETKQGYINYHFLLRDLPSEYFPSTLQRFLSKLRHLFKS